LRRVRSGPPVPLLRRGADRPEGGREARQARPVLVTPGREPALSKSAPPESAGPDSVPPKPAVPGSAPSWLLRLADAAGTMEVPVLAWWRRPSAVAPVDAGEVAAVERVSVAELADPATRLMLRMPSGRSSPAFRVRGMLIWGFTAALVDRLLALGGWEKPWDA